MHRRIVSLLLILIIIPSLAWSKKRKPWQDPVETVSLGYTHLLPSAYVLPHLNLVLGSTIGMGLFDVAEISSNLYLDVQQAFNLSTKVSLLANEDFAFALFASYITQQVRVKYTIANTTRMDEKFDTMTSIRPGGVFSYLILPKLSGHIGVEYSIRNPEIKKDDLAKKTSFVRGTTVYKEFTYGFKKGMAVSAGGSYDLSYDVPGVGASLHIGSFQIGGHYFFSVVEGPFQPIIAGSYSTEL